MIKELIKDFPEWIKMILPIAIILFCLVIGLLIRKYLFSMLKRVTGKTETKIDDVLFAVLKKPFLLWFAILGLEISSKTFQFNEKIENIIDNTLIVIWIISMVLVLGKLTLEILQLYYQKRNSSFQTTSILQNIIKLIFFFIGLLFILNALGISITPIITALGIGGLAVALALQDTLNNLFSGFYITLSQQTRVGDYIQLENGSEGWVKDIGWRNTTLLLLTNNYIIIPNAKLAQNIITNYSLPEGMAFLKIPIGVDFNSDISHVEKVILETVKNALPDIPGTIIDPPPSLLFYPGPESFSLVFTLTVAISKYADRSPIISEIKKAIFLKFREEKINIPFPVQTIYLKKEN